MLSNLYEVINEKYAEVLLLFQSDTTFCFIMPPVGWHIAVELSVRLTVFQSVCPSENFNIGHNFCNIKDSNLILSLACMCILWSCTF